MAKPRPNFLDHIEMLNIAPGAFASAGGGTILKTSKEVVVRIDGNDANVFSVSALETQALVLERDPDAPPGSPRVGHGQTALTVDGSGPITVESGEALKVTVVFACPAKPKKDAYAATANVFAASDPGTSLLPVPVSGRVSPGSVTIVSLAPLSLAAGNTPGFPSGSVPPFAGTQAVFSPATPGIQRHSLPTPIRSSL